MAKEQNQINCQLLTAQDVGEILNLSKRQIFRLNSTGQIPKPLRIGGSVRWSRDEISVWIIEGCPDRQTWKLRKSMFEGENND